MSGGSKRSNYERKGVPISGNDCLNVNFTTHLFSPSAVVISGLMKGESLDIVLNPTSNAVEAITSSGAVAGTVLGKKTIGLAVCLKSGYEYQATILDLDGGNCRIKIMNK